MMVQLIGVTIVMKRNLIFIIGFFWFIVDLITKLLVSNLLVLDASNVIIDNFFYLTYTHNYGAAWSIFTGNIYFLIIVGILIIGFMLYYIAKNKVSNIWEILGYGLFLGGAFGNIVDRIVNGYVTDFLDFRFGNYYFPIFNVADIGIVIGVFLLLIDTFRRGKND